ncbi:MAG: UDP-glucose 6-dehydrogenase [Candidatus Buchananbacteria bacterium RIFCSPLOWO2_01_FULL_56_15]|uniref:UDP-glucose 6-dehydrogenase n=2 Tax=Candidatus Buchananiibacteriota TaxID=1817903 RepID=A0A1G1YF23_9BACT|nr:MAG: UDP-glucose 6-dehydrogenase [Candidatus Buchananbacteria bacterium RIFCSPHIGHO2_02_FULL_56_16]OGY55414.1 MAG: UDP-glucose 6-dehydrogenase [Candidatus Buchananbacteria bacterium RIFCSPLOWO2_01_FULL_56_15]
MKVAIIGTGYVGLTTGVCLADLGHQVVCVDNDPAKLALLQQHRAPIFEPGIEALIAKNAEAGRLTFSAEIVPAVRQSDVIFICVNTPPKADGTADLKYVEQVARETAKALNGGYKVIVDKSTVPVTTAEKVRETIERYKTEHTTFDVVSNPEFLREGSALHDTFEPDRIVIGADSERGKRVMLELYRPLIEKIHAPVKIVSVRSAELIKHGANTFLAAKISFANLIAELCEHSQADSREVLEAIGIDPRIGRQFLSPGIGFGGSCFPKDIAAFKKTLETAGIDPAFVRAIEQINDRAWRRFVSRLEQELWVIDGKTIGVLGLSFKPNTDDIRNAPALKIIEKLKADGARLKVYDPQAMGKVKQLFTDVEYCHDPYQVAKGSQALVLCTEWEEFKTLDFKKIKAQMATPLIFDGRNALNPAELTALGFRYVGVGR